MLVHKACSSSSLLKSYRYIVYILCLYKHRILAIYLVFNSLTQDAVKCIPFYGFFPREMA